MISVSDLEQLDRLDDHSRFALIVRCISSRLRQLTVPGGYSLASSGMIRLTHPLYETEPLADHHCNRSQLARIERNIRIAF